MKPAHRHNADTEYNKDGLTDCGGRGWEGKGRWEEGGEGGGGGPYRESAGNEESRRETSRDNMHTSKRFFNSLRFVLINSIRLSLYVFGSCFSLGYVRF